MVNYQLDFQQENADISVAVSTGEFATGKVDYLLDFQQENFQQEKFS